MDEIKRVWFKDGLDEVSLREEYRKLAKKWHPDVCKDPNASQYMQEINYQFDQYWVNRKEREYEWIVKTANVHNARSTKFVFVTRDRDHPGQFITKFHDNYWGYAVNTYTSVGGTGWEGAKSGFAFIRYDDNGFGESPMHRIPARFAVPTIDELYFYTRIHYSDSEYTTWFHLQTNYGTLWCKDINGRGTRLEIPMKVLLDAEALKIGNVSESERAYYDARSIQTVAVDRHLLGHTKQLNRYNGRDLAMLRFQDCTYTEFCKWHTITPHPMKDVVGVNPIPANDCWFIDDPVIGMYARKGIIKFYASKRNFRIRFGVFDVDNELRRNLHLSTVDGIEAAQDYLDQLWDEFSEHVKSLIKTGKVSFKI